MLTYNIAGLPQGLKEDTQPAVNIPKMAPLLNRYEFALLQEDFAYHDELVRDLTHPFISSPADPIKLVNDGLTFLSKLPISEPERHAWEHCHGGLSHGSDCLADKGFAIVRVELGQKQLDVYDLHLDAGRDAEDWEARALQIEQLRAAVEEKSRGRAVVIGGDFNLKMDATVDDAGLMRDLIHSLDLVDSCAAVSCGDERIDRILFRSSDDMELEATEWTVDDRFVDQSGQDLSDHKAVAVDLLWKADP